MRLRWRSHCHKMQTRAWSGLCQAAFTVRVVHRRRSRDPRNILELRACAQGFSYFYPRKQTRGAIQLFTWTRRRIAWSHPAVQRVVIERGPWGRWVDKAKALGTDGVTLCWRSYAQRLGNANHTMSSERTNDWRTVWINLQLPNEFGFCQQNDARRKRSAARWFCLHWHLIGHTDLNARTTTKKPKLFVVCRSCDVNGWRFESL